MAQGKVTIRHDYDIGQTLDISFNPCPSPFTDESQTTFIEIFKQKNQQNPNNHGQFNIKTTLCQDESSKIDALNVRGKLDLTYGPVSGDAHVKFAMRNVAGSLDLTVILNAVQKGRVVKNDVECVQLKLRPAVQKRIDSGHLTFEKFKQEYGEYLIIGFEYGGHVCFKATYKTRSSQDKLSVAGGLSITYGKMGFNLHGEAKGKYKTDDIKKSTDIKTECEIFPSHNVELINGENGIITLLNKMSNPMQNGLKQDDEKINFGNIKENVTRKIQELLSSNELDTVNCIVLPIKAIGCVNDALGEQMDQVQDIQAFCKFANPLYFAMEEMLKGLITINDNYDTYASDDKPDQQINLWFDSLQKRTDLMKTISGKRLYQYAKLYIDTIHNNKDDEKQSKEIEKTFYTMNKVKLKNQFNAEILVPYNKMMENMSKPQKQFESTKYATCAVTPMGDYTLCVNPGTLESVQEYYDDVISLVGPPGSGKSTLASSIYNVMRENKEEYFEASDCMEGFTKGIWTLNQQTKKAKIKYDYIDVLDLEGLEDVDSIHYLVVVAMALSKAILLCADYRSPRFKFDMFKTINAGINIYKKNKILIPNPIIYVQVPYNQNQFKLRKKTVDKNGLIDEIKQRFKELKDFEIRVFSLPTFKDENRFDEKYTSSVTELINELKKIGEKIQISMKDRVKYAYGVIDALNNNSPSIVVKMNLRFFQNDIMEIKSNTKKNIIKNFRQIATRKSNEINGIISSNEFCKLVYKNDKYYYCEELIQNIMSSPFYDSNDIKQQEIIKSITDDKQKYMLEPKHYLEDIYNAIKSQFSAFVFAVEYQSDKGGGAKSDVKFYRPKQINGYYCIGVTCTNSSGSDVHLVMVKGKEGIDIKRPVGMKKIWTDKGSRKSWNYQMWRPQAPPGFKSLSDIPNFRTKKANGDNKWNNYKNTIDIWCVSDKLCQISSIQNQLWNDGGSRANADCSIYRIEGTNFIISNNTHNKPLVQVYKLKFN
eukprot:226968_1